MIRVLGKLPKLYESVTIFSTFFAFVISALVTEIFPFRHHGEETGWGVSLSATVGGRAEAEVIAFEIRRTEKCGDATMRNSNSRDAKQAN